MLTRGGCRSPSSAGGARVLRRLVVLSSIIGILGTCVVAAASGEGAPTVAGVSALLTPSVTLPPELVALEQKMAQLQLNSERFSLVSRGSINVTNETNGKPERPGKYVSLNGTELGEASVSPAEGEIFEDGRHTPTKITIGSTVYEYERPTKGSHRHRPWVRSRDSGESPAMQILPFRGGGPVEVDAGGTGSFALLINLLATAVGPVTADGPAVVRGQQTAEFTATVEPLKLLKGFTNEDLGPGFKPLTETLHIFLTESGLPIRVLKRIRSRDIKSDETTEIVAINVPVVVKPPPARETREQRRAG
jgi:hypothetical protein